MGDSSKGRSEAVTLARLPQPDSSVDVISARSLHKAIRVGGGSAVEQKEYLRAYLEECHRVLVPGGRLEYIYFGDKLLACGPLTGELEAVLWEVWTEKGGGGHGHGPAVDDFLALLDQVGFADGKHLTMKFGLFTLNSLFDYRGVRRAGTATVFGAEHQQLGSQYPLFVGDLGPRDYIDQKAHELRLRVYEECVLRGTGWECVIGYATKAS